MIRPTLASPLLKKVQFLWNSCISSYWSELQGKIKLILSSLMSSITRIPCNNVSTSEWYRNATKNGTQRAWMVEDFLRVVDGCSLRCRRRMEQFKEY